MRNSGKISLLLCIAFFTGLAGSVSALPTITISYQCYGVANCPAANFAAKCSDGTNTWNGTGSFPAITNGTFGGAQTTLNLPLTPTTCSMTVPAACSAQVFSTAPRISIISYGGVHPNSCMISG